MLRIRKRGECHQDCDCIFFPARVNCLLGNSWNFIRQLAAGTADECRSKFRHIVVGNDISLIVQYNRDGPQFFATRTNVSQCDNYYDCGGYFALINIPATRRLNWIRISITGNNLMKCGRVQWQQLKSGEVHEPISISTESQWEVRLLTLLQFSFNWKWHRRWVRVFLN